jgi:predicted RND superfamily exporter protein
MVVVAVITAGILAGGIAGMPNLKTDFDMEWFTPDDSYYQDTYDVQEKYFPSGTGYPVYVFTKTGSYYTAHNDRTMDALYQRTLDNSWVDRSISNWYTGFIAADANRASKVYSSESQFAAELQTYLQPSAAGARYSRDVIFETAASGTAIGIRGTRAMYLAVTTNTGGEDIKLMKSVRSTVNGYTLDSFVFSKPLLYFDGLDVIAGETIQNVLVACGIVFVVMLLMLADILASVLVVAMVGLVDVCLLGYMAHWDLDFNSVTAINCVIAVGLAVDYSAHIAHSYLVARGSGLERAKEAIDHIGMSVFHGGFSTLLAVLPLGMSKSYVFRVLFKMWFMIIIFGSYFGIIVLPIMLRCLGPFIGSQEPRESDGDKASKDMSPDVVGNKEDAGA